jgi:hypothetical protein
MACTGSVIVAFAPIPTSTAVPAGRSAVMAGAGDRFDAGALQQHVGPDVGELRSGGHRLVDAERQRLLQPGGVDVGDRDVCGARGAGHQPGEHPDRAGCGDQHPRAGGHPGLAARPDADRQRFDQGGAGIGERIGHGEGEVGIDHHLLGQRAVTGGVAKNRTSGQRLYRPARHCSQRRQGTPGSSATRWPRARWLTAEPTAITVPPLSWPRIIGASRTNSPIRSCS